MIKEYDLIGLIPFITRESIENLLDPEEITVFDSIVNGVQGGEITHQPQIPVGQLLTIMEHLGIDPIWGKEGTKVYRMNLGDRLPIFIIAPDPATDSIPVEVLERQFIAFDKLDDLVLAILAETKAIRDRGEEAKVYAEDHPEFDSVGFISFQANKVWTIASPQIEASKGEPTQFALLHTLIQSNEGRVELAQRMATGQLMSATEYMDSYLGLQSRTPDAAKILRRKEQEVTIDLMSGKLSDVYKRRFLPQAPAPMPDIVVPPAQADQGGDVPAGQGE